MPVYKAKNGTWFFKCSLNGRQFLRRGFSSRRDAKLAESSFVVQNQNQRKAKKVAVITFNQLVDFWLKYKKNKVRISSYESIHYEVKKYIWGKLPDIDIQRLVFEDFNQWLHFLKSQPIRKKNTLIGYFKSIFEYATVYWNYSGKDYLKIETNKKYDAKSSRKNEKKILSIDEFSVLLGQAKKVPFMELFCLLLFFFGLRFNEARGLRVCDFDRNFECFYFDEQVKSKSSKRIETKTESSARRYFIPKELQSKLSGYVKEHGLKEKNYLFYSPQDKNIPLSETNLRKKFKTVLSESHIEGITPHSLRHTNTSELISKGIPLDVVSKYEGHSSESITRNVYLHVTRESEEKIKAIQSEILKKLYQ